MGEYKATKPRGPIAAMYGSPGPCYGLPGLTGEIKHDPRSVHSKGPGYKFGIRHGKHREYAGPGPAHHPDPRYSRTGPEGSPKYSIYSRTNYGQQVVTPGPGQYKPEDVGPTSQPKAPAYSFGDKRKSKRTDDTPGPNQYTVDPMLGKTVRGGKKTAPCHSIIGRSNVGAFHEDLAKTPGPGNYGTTDPDTYKEKRPQYTMTGRSKLPGDSTQKPGPGTYSAETVTADKKAAPKFCFGIRHSPYTTLLLVDADD